MLKVLKHEFLATGKIMGIVYGISLFLAGIANLIGALVPGGLTSSNSAGVMFLSVFYMLSIMCLMATIVGTIIMLCSRFNSAMLGKSAYFTFSLPLKNYVHIVARLINTAIYTAFMVLAATLQIFFLVGFQNIGWIFFGSAEAVSILMCIICICIITTFASVMSWYAALSLGTVFTKNRILGMIISLFIFNVAGSILISFIMIPFSSSISDVLNALFSGVSTVHGALWVIFSVILFFVTLLAALFYWIIWHMTCRKLHVENV